MPLFKLSDSFGRFNGWSGLNLTTSTAVSANGGSANSTNAPNVELTMAWPVATSQDFSKQSAMENKLLTNLHKY
eukprot:370249-Amphidinium_carterae.1